MKTGNTQNRDPGRGNDRILSGSQNTKRMIGGYTSSFTGRLVKPVSVSIVAFCLLSLAGLVQGQTSLRISEVTTPWTNQAGNAVTSGPVTYNEAVRTKTTEWTGSESERDGKIRLTQGTFPNVSGLKLPAGTPAPAGTQPAKQPAGVQTPAALPVVGQGGMVPGKGPALVPGKGPSPAKTIPAGTPPAIQPAGVLPSGVKPAAPTMQTPAASGQGFPSIPGQTPTVRPGAMGTPKVPAAGNIQKSVPSPTSQPAQTLPRQGQSGMGAPRPAASQQVTIPQGGTFAPPAKTTEPVSPIVPQGAGQKKSGGEGFLRPEQIAPEGGRTDGRGSQIKLPTGDTLDLNPSEDYSQPTGNLGTPLTGSLSTEAENAVGTYTNPFVSTDRNNRDGYMQGNPYSIGGTNALGARCDIADYHPGQFPADQSAAQNRFGVPEAAYGTDGWGNTAYQCGGMLGRCNSLLQNSQFSFGLLGYTTPMDIANKGNFGGDIAFNWATPKRYLLGLSAQAGGRLTMSGQDLYDDEIITQDKNDTQLFWTTGLYFRNPCRPWKFGVVYDSLNSTYYSSYTLGQIRTELSRSFGCRTDLGFRGAFRIADDLVNWYRHVGNLEYQANARSVSYYTGFIRRYFDMGGEGMIFGGVTDDSEALVGGQIEVPISNYASLKNSFTYVFDKENEERNIGLTRSRTWNVSVSLVIYFGGNSREAMRNPLRPLFDVADNGTFLQRPAR